MRPLDSDEALAWALFFAAQCPIHVEPEGAKAKAERDLAARAADAMLISWRERKKKAPGCASPEAFEREMQL